MDLFQRMSFIEGIIDSLAPTVSLTTFFDAISDGIDEQILSQREQGRAFIGGKTYFSLSSDGKEILIEAELYYVTEDKNYKKQEFSGMFWLSRIHASERQKVIDMLSSNRKLCIEVLKPY